MVKLSTVSRVVSVKGHRYGHDPAHYPIKAVAFVMSNPSLWRRVAFVACFGAVVSFMSLILLLVFALKPQAQAFGGGQWWSWLLAVLVVLLEAAVVSILVLTVAHSRCQSEVFHKTMVINGKWRDDMTKQSIIKDLNVFKRAFFVRVLTYPLNLIPFLGAALYSAINATFVGWDYMDMYFDAIHMSGKDQRIEVFGEDRSDCASLCSCSTYDRDNEYARFGFICTLLEMIPLVGIVFFPLTNACAAALFACDIEAAGGPISVRPPPEAEPPQEQTGMMGKVKELYKNSKTRSVPIEETENGSVTDYVRQP